MTSRVQVFRTPTTGVAPASGTRQPGELWVNFADFQLGMIDASKTAQKLVAVRYFQTTANYATGDFVIQAGALYAAKGAITAGAFNSTQWTKVAAATDPGGPYLPIAGGTLTGALVLAADPGAALGAATKQYVDGKVTAAPFLPLAGGTLTGLVTLSGPPSAPLHAATKAYVDSGSFLPLSGGTLTGALTPSQTAGIVGTTTNNNAAAGAVGEYIISDKLTNVALTTAVVTNITTISLTAGDWNVQGTAYVTFTASGTFATAGVSTTSATLPGTTYTGKAFMGGAGLTDVCLATSAARVSVAVTTTVYLVASGNFSSGTCAGQGSIMARRVR